MICDNPKGLLSSGQRKTICLLYGQSSKRVERRPFHRNQSNNLSI
ncbi:MAG: hypothetical protein Q4C95_00760 [Planctomycetia bacterium]|nr:hypothetical protein [Planctomycetia bacterium]